jgi:hypothetical protein
MKTEKERDRQTKRQTESLFETSFKCIGVTKDVCPSILQNTHINN